MPDWLVGQSMPKQEAVAHASLTGMGFNCYQPKFRERVVVNGRKTWHERLLLGRYLLIELAFDFVSCYHSIISAKGVSSLLTADEKPLTARDKEVRQLMSSEVKGCVPVIVRQDRFKKGQKVFIIKGPFSDHSGQYVKGTESRDVVGLELFGRLIPIELELGRLIAA